MEVVPGYSVESDNQTIVTEFILQGFAYFSNRAIIFVVFLAIFLMTVIGNSLIILAIRMNLSLHTPMYFFLSNLSFLEICYTSTTIPNVLSGILRGTNVISFTGCIIQVYLFTLCATTEFVLLAVMACDRYVAICRPLRYKAMINRLVCTCLAAFAWLCGFLNSTVNTTVTSHLHFCGPNLIDQLYCEVQPLIRLSCSSTHLIDTLDTIAVSCLLFILTTYIFILVAVFRMPCRSSRQKTLSTCASHVIVVTLYFGSLTFVYLLPSNSSSQTLNSVFSMIYSTVTPLLNPITYSLRNKQVIGALKNIMVLRRNCHQTVVHK